MCKILNNKKKKVLSSTNRKSILICYMNFYLRNQNHILTSFLTSLKKVTETPLIQDLIVAALVACPDQLQYYLPSLQNSLIPRVSEKWISAMEFLNKVSVCWHLYLILVFITMIFFTPGPAYGVLVSDGQYFWKRKKS